MVLHYTENGAGNLQGSKSGVTPTEPGRAAKPGRKDRAMTIYTARHRRDPWASIRYTLAQPLRLRGMIAVGAVTGLMLGALIAISFVS